MHLPVPKAGLIGLTAIFAIVAAMAVFIYSSGGNSAEAATYTPTSAVRFCNALAADFPSSKPFTDGDLAGTPGCAEGAIPASTSRNYTVTFSVAGGQSNFGLSVVTNVPGTTAPDATLADGTKVGGLRSDVTLGLLNGACSTALIAEFILYDSATGGAPVAVAAEGTANRFSSIVTDGNADEIADPSSPLIVSNLDIYENLLTPAGGSYATPHARYTGASRVPAGGDWQILSFFQFEPGDLDGFTTGDDEPNQLGRISHAPVTGYNSLSILNDPTATAISISPIHDFCSPLVVQTMLLGDPPGAGVRYTTPTAGTAGISNHSGGQRDADNDGLTNAEDTCPLAANSGTDTDGDGIDNACDTNTPTATGTDVDGDGFQNRQDNCPQIANGSPQVDSEVGATYISAAPDGGTKGDSIGDPCDPAPLTSTGQGAIVEAYNLVVKCIGGTDGDGDGYCAPQDLDDGNAAVGGFASNPGMDQEYKNGSGTQGDHGDGMGGNFELYQGGNPLVKCGVAGAWPFDLVFNNTVNISDVLALKPVFGGAVTVGGPAFPKFDLVPNKVVNISDVLALKPQFGKACTP